MIVTPRRAAAAIALAARTALPGFMGALWQAFYVINAAILAEYLKHNRFRHLHKHSADSSRSLAMLTSQLSGVSFSFRFHGPLDLYEPKSWQKIVRAEVVSCISHFVRSQSAVFAKIRSKPVIRRYSCA